MEIWKSIPEYEGCYEVSSYGAVRSLDRYVRKSNGVVQFRHGIQKMQIRDADGYKHVKLSKHGKDKTFAVHTLVAMVFVDGYFDGAEVNHRDFNRENNYYANLEWVTHEENIHHTMNSGRHYCQRDLHGENNPNFGNHSLSQRYSSDKKLAKEKQSRPGAKNGRSLKIQAIINEQSLVFDYIGECAEYLIQNKLVKSKSASNVSAHISKAAKENKKYYGHSFTTL